MEKILLYPQIVHFHTTIYHVLFGRMSKSNLWQLRATWEVVNFWWWWGGGGGGGGTDIQHIIANLTYLVDQFLKEHLIECLSP